MKFEKYLVFVLIILLFASCQRETPDKMYRIGVSQCSSDAWRTKMNQEMERELLFHPEFTLDIVSANDDSKKQCEDIDNFIKSGVDLLIVCPNEAYGVTDAVSRAYDAGIPVIVADRRVYGDKYTAFVGGDNLGVGAIAADFVTKSLPEGGEIIEILGLKGSTPSVLRSQGFDSVMAKYPSIKVVSKIYGDWKAEKAYELMLQQFALHPNVDVVFAQNDIMAIAACNAADKVLPDNHILFIGVDAIIGEDNGIDAILDGCLDASVSYATAGDVLIKRASDIVNGNGFARDTIIKSFLVDRASADVLYTISQRITHEIETVNLLEKKIDGYWKAYNSQQVVLYLIVAIALILILSLGYYIKNYNEKKETLDKLSKAKEDVERANASKLTFFTNVSHDFRTPLTLVADPIEQIDKIGDLNEQQKLYLNLARQNSAILLRLVSQILDFRKIESDKFELNYSKADLAECIRIWSSSFYVLSKRNHVALNVNIDSGQDYIIGIDVNLIERVFYNIMANAFKFTPENGLIEVRLWRESDKCIFSISDNGLPISEDHAKRIFDNFYQIDTNNSSGSGIGLALVKSLVNMHGGTIELKHNDRNDTMFVVTLPVNDNVNSLNAADNICKIDSDKVMLELKEEAHIDDDKITSDDQKVALVIDDNYGIRLYLKSLLSDKYAVITAESGSEGIAKAMQYVPTIIICDVAMPGIDGYGVCHKLKSETATSHIPVILLTAYSLDEQKIRGLEEGAEAYIAKPFNSDVLIAQMESLIKNRFISKSSTGDALSTPLQRVNPLDDEFMSRLVAYIDNNISTADLNVEDMGADLGMSRTQLYRKVKSLTNYSPNEFIRKRRLEKARQLLSTGQYNISTVGFMTGFSSPSYFTKCYKDYFGENPTSTVTPDSDSSHN